LFWEHEGNCGVRRGSWKLVKFFGKPWELYNLETDGSELNDLSRELPEIAQELGEAYVRWAQRANVHPREHYLLYEKRKAQNEQVVDLTKMKRRV
jgi:arylsulfatase